MREDLKQLYVEGNDIFGLPQKYKGIDLYPIKIKDMQYLSLFYRLFFYPKNYIPDARILKMSYLKYLLYVVQASISPEGTEIQNQIVELIKYITKTEVEIAWKMARPDGTLDDLIIIIKIGGYSISEPEFDEIREIILEQNGSSIEYVEEYNPELETHLSFINRQHSDLDFKDEVFAFCALMGMGIEEVGRYTIFQFRMAFEKLIILKDYELYKPLLTSGEITLKSGDIKHFLYHSVKSGRYDSIKVDVDTFMEDNKEAFNPPS